MWVRGTLLPAIVISVAAVSCTNDPPKTSTTTTATSTTATSTSAMAITTTDLPSATAPSNGILGPSVDPRLCDPLAAHDGVMSTFDLHLFATPSAGPFSIQIIGDPAGGPTAPFALLQRYPDPWNMSLRGTEKINGWHVAVRAYDNGNGEARWSLPSGGHGYIRSRGLDRVALIGIIAALTERGPGAAVPGFDYAPDTTVSPGLTLLVEHMNTGVRGRTAWYQCQVKSTNYIYQIASIEGDPVFQYAGVIDRPVPIEVGFQDGTLVVIGGINDPTAPTIHDIVNADPIRWKQLVCPTCG